MRLHPQTIITAVALAVAITALGGCSRQGAKPPEIGRYVIVTSSNADRNRVLLDTATGRTWSPVELSDLTDEPLAWEPMPQLNSPADLAALKAAHPPKAADGPWPGTPVPPSRPDFSDLVPKTKQPTKESWADLAAPKRPSAKELLGPVKPKDTGGFTPVPPAGD